MISEQEYGVLLAMGHHQIYSANKNWGAILMLIKVMLVVNLLLVVS